MDRHDCAACVRSRERGSATVYATALIGVVIALLGGALALISANVASTRARAAADFGALAAATEVSEAGAEPCARAEGLVRANGGVLLACEVVGETVEVRAGVDPTWPGLGTATARSRAGPGQAQAQAVKTPTPGLGARQHGDDLPEEVHAPAE